MKSIVTKFLVPVIVLVAVFLGLDTRQEYSARQRDMLDLIDRQAALTLAFDLAIREYVAEEIRPVMEERAAPGEFIPETMSTSFVARSIFERVRQDFPDYIIKFSSDDPRNPANQAGPDELRMIQYFNDNPEIKTWDGEIELNGRPHLAHFSARRMKEGCLRCHGVPEEAPASLVERYGPTAGFRRPVGEVIALDTVAIPLDKPRAAFMANLRDKAVFRAAALTVLVVLIAVAFRFVVARRLASMGKHFERIAAQPDAAAFQTAEVRGRDEISVLTHSFNVMVERLSSAHVDLEQRVADRTAELQKANRELLREADERREAQQAAADHAIALEKSRREAMEMMEEAEWARKQAEEAQQELRLSNEKMREALHREKNIALELEATMGQYQAAKRDAEGVAAELAEKLEEVEAFNRVAVGRELRMIVLKEEINGLLAEQDKPPAYEIAKEEAPA